MTESEEALLRARVDVLEAAVVAIKRYCADTELRSHARLNLIEAVCALVTPPQAK
jgi:hypothetical protein